MQRRSSKRPIRSKSSHVEHQIIEFNLLRRHITVLIDKVLFLRFLRNLHGRFWGITGISIMCLGFSICFAIRPELLSIETAFSDFGNDVRTAPYFAGSVFFAAYGMWRWQKYLKRTWKRGMPITGLIWLTVIGLYLIALMPVEWYTWPHRLHMAGVILAGLSMLATVVLDWLLTKPRPGHTNWRLLRTLSLVLIVSGGWLTLGSTNTFQWYNVSLLGETMMIGGYLLWIALKTYLGEGNRTAFSRLLKRVVFID